MRRRAAGMEVDGAGALTLATRIGDALSAPALRLGMTKPRPTSEHDPPGRVEERRIGIDRRISNYE